ncbi:MAG: DUF4134 domain-containing protein [Ignavibacterium sp.]|jgi:hypothetical protein|nr:MAG: DUF4134 domain-containing protein [Ignavibacterium sp.]
MKRKIHLLAAVFFTALSTFAQGNGIGGITDATNMVTSYFDPGTQLIYAIFSTSNIRSMYGSN